MSSAHVTRQLDAGSVASSVVLHAVVKRARFGCKGPGAAEFLLAHHVRIPQRANHWTNDAEQDCIVTRLGTSEFFIEHSGAHDLATRLDAALGAGLTDVYPVLREDFGCVLVGADAHAVLAQTCSVNFAELDSDYLDETPLAMTMMVGVAVLVVANRAQHTYRIWCDPSFGTYLWQTLKSVVEDGGGRAFGEGAHLSGTHRAELQR